MATSSAVLEGVNSESSSSSQSEENSHADPIMRIPNEVWVLILSQLNQKELVQARTVWKRWREVVDAHFEFTVIVHDGKTDLDRVHELRIRDCLVTRLLSDKEIFQFPSLLRRIRFWGPINVNCFQRIMDKAVNVEELSCTKFALMQEDLVGERKLSGFSKIKKLELLGYMCKDESRAIAKNASQIFSYNMPELEKLTVNFHCDIASINRIAVSFMEFVSRHNRLHNLQASLVPEANHPNETAASRTTSVVIPESVEELLKHVQLNMLRITTATKDLPIWTALLNSQTHLQDLRMHLSEGGLLTVHTNYVIGIPFDIVRAPLQRNANTLTSVELKELRLPAVDGSHADALPLDASVFRYSFNLKRLVLYRNLDDYRRFSQYPDQPNITNLKMLPTTIEVLEISRFYCKSEELQFVVDVLENLKNIVLLHTGNLSRLGVHGGIVESISKKSGVQSMNLTPLNYHSTIENLKYDVVKQKFGMNDGDHLYYDFERFRKGLPQPRPPQVDSTYNNVVRSQNDTTFQCSTRRWTYSYSRRRREGRTGTPAERRARSRRSRMEAFIGRMLCPATSRPARHCRCQAPPPGGHVEGQCPGDPLSRLFFSLDLHISDGQQCITEVYALPRETVRQRRWSGDIRPSSSSSSRRNPW
ncbi:hypothetical protein Ocin01_07933 [Orchesella cincta]|uniref:F-box domain-containing protein n=1 Tax=Orchesella cincta TaxID=48709 RepID=A0A1D2N0I7_ORCCI|nr:hypothetical protein Ocin01_07933 [Orchesella cincta]